MDLTYLPWQIVSTILMILLFLAILKVHTSRVQLLGLKKKYTELLHQHEVRSFSEGTKNPKLNQKGKSIERQEHDTTQEKE